MIIFSVFIRIRQFEFSQVHVTFDIPKVLALSDCAVRVLITKYDHLSPSSKSILPRRKIKEPGNHKLIYVCIFKLYSVLSQLLSKLKSYGDSKEKKVWIVCRNYLLMPMMHQNLFIIQKTQKDDPIKEPFSNKRHSDYKISQFGT